ncbi:hypothetical protein PR202_gb06296 [Eleusine coracana subsp. coracana]|uniref:Hexosyltransferase n=1 Tax=Eleusine coracana subsp. coracana TaxID=191504 RepID=A0AAV5E963_ELECO|nr:hypothetical protein PR202_gb06296 [Eleusine coracana subsp. coracana]
MSWKRAGGADGGVSRRWAVLLCVGSFCLGLLFTNRMWTLPEASEIARPNEKVQEGNLPVAAECGSKKVQEEQVYKDIIHVQDTHHDIQYVLILTLDKTIASLETELSAARSLQESLLNGSPVSEDFKISEPIGRRKYRMVIGINTAFSSRKRRDSIRYTWMPQGEKRKKLEEEKGIIIRFVIGHSAISGGIVDRAIEAEDRKHQDFMRIDHVEGYLALSGKTKTYFATAVSLWDADFYIKVDDDVHVNIGKSPCKGVRYYEPEHWKFGEAGNKYFRHATGQLYALSKDLATYISINKHILHKYINEDVSLGSWFIGLDVEHIDDKRLCCGTPPDCEWKAQAGNICAASFDWRCSGICNSEGRIWEVHNKCAEGEKALWNATF